MPDNEQLPEGNSNPSAVEVPPYLPADPISLGGWLILPLLGLIINPFLLGFGTVSLWPAGRPATG